MTTPPVTPQRPLWQQLGIWVIALVAAAGLIAGGNSALTSHSPQEPPASAPAESSVSDDTTPPVDQAKSPPEPVESEQESDVADSEEENASPESAPDSQSVDYLTAAQQLGALLVAPRVSRDGYNREEQFGSAWIDVDNNGCDTRNDILRRDLDDIVIDSRCRVLSGTLVEPITGNTISFLRGEVTSAEVQIDHVVSLSNAWQTGAQNLTRQQRIAFANDPLNLIAVSGSLNAQKGDSDAASWLPPRFDYWCEYVARQVGVKSHYSLWVTQAERDQMSRVLNACPGYPALTPGDHGRFRPGDIPLP